MITVERLVICQISPGEFKPEYLESAHGQGNPVNADPHVDFFKMSEQIYRIVISSNYPQRLM